MRSAVLGLLAACHAALGLLAACHTASAPAAATAPSSDQACAPALPLLAKQHTPNSSKLYVAPLAIADGAVRVGAPALVTAKRGYVNQPAFTPDGTGLYFTWRPVGSQSDIWLHDLRTGAERAVTCTSLEEYAARPIGADVAVIRVEADLSRHVVKLAGGAAQPLFPSLATVGAHLWLDDHTAAVFDPGPDGAPSTIVLADARTGALTTLATDVGPSMAVIPGSHALSYIDLRDEHHPVLMRLDLDTRATSRLLDLPDGVTGVTWLADGSLVRGDGTRILRATLAAPGWAPIADLAGALAGPILGLYPNGARLAIVVHVD